MIELRLLGGVEFRATNGRNPELILAHEKSFALLAYLAAAHPFGSHRRDSLVALLWPELDQEHARTALRKALHGLRHAIGADAIVSSGDETIGIAEAVLWCDVRAFDDAVRGNRPAGALALYRGDFLPGASLSDAPEFERWVDRERQELRASAARAAWMATEESERAGKATESIQWGRRAFRLAPDDEHGARKLIALLDRLGDRAGAIRVYEQFERYLASELEVAPSLETASLIARIRSSSPLIPSVRSNASGHRTPSIVGEFDTADGHAETMNPALDSAKVLDTSKPTEAGVPTLSTRRPGWRVRAAWVIALVIALTVLSAVAATRHPPRPVVSLDNTHVAVMPLQNETGRPDLDFVGLEVQDWVSRGLQETGLARVYAVDKGVVVTAANAIGRGPGEDDRNSAASLGAGMIVRGRYYLRADSILMEVSIVDVGGGGTLATLAPVVGSTTDPTAAIDVVRRRTIAVLATHVDPELKQWASAASQPPSFEAYREFSEGQQAKNRVDYEAAIAHFLRAAALDSGYVYPILMAAQLVDEDSAAALLRTVRARHLRLAPFDNAFADVLEAQLAHDFERAFDADQRLRRYVTPGSEWDLYAAADAIALNRPSVAMEIVKSVDLDRPLALNHWEVFESVTNAYHLVGENEALLALLRKEGGQYRHAALFVTSEMLALAALSRPAEADSLWRTMLHNRPFEEKGIVMWVAWMGAREMRAHGSADAARRFAIEALDSLSTLPASSKFGDPMRWRMQVLREAGRPREAQKMAQAFAAKDPHEANMAAITAALSAELGDTATARRIEARLAHWTAVADPRDILLPRARLAAALGNQAAAVALLHAACDRGCARFEDLHAVLEFDGLRSYPPFQELLRPKPGF
jgi:DNA-binding SARP family transcriptional activator